MLFRSNVFTAGSLCVILVSSAALAVDYPLSAGFSNYYFNEPTGVDWAVNAKVTIAPPPVGSALPASLALGFKFSWNTVDGTGNDQAVFRTYTRGTTAQKGTQFDLLIAPESTGVFAYAQATTVRPTISASPTTATVTFSTPPLTAAANTTNRYLFEIYGDCEECARNQEAHPPDDDHTTWRIHGKILVTADASGKLANIAIVDLGSDVPQKKLDRNGNIHDPSWYPRRKLARRHFVTTVEETPAASERQYGACRCASRKCGCCKSRRFFLRRGR